MDPRDFVRERMRDALEARILGGDNAGEEVLYPDVLVTPEGRALELDEGAVVGELVIRSGPGGVPLMFRVGPR